MRRKLLITLALFITLFNPLVGHAKDAGFLGLSLGYFNVLRGQRQAVNVRMEYRPERSFVFKSLKPWIGGESTTNGSFWAGGGWALEYNPSKNLFITPSLGAGYYSHGDGDVDLDHPIQFRSQIEFAYALKDKSRISMAFSHMSNAGLGDSNPGAEAFMLYYSIPLGSLEDSPK